MMYSSRFLITVRNLTRKLGLNKLILGILDRGGYEDKFGKAILERLQDGDCVWDIGANVGYYSSQFSARVGNEGMVIAFEPVPACYMALKLRVKNISTIQTVNVAIGAKDREVLMVLENEDLSSTHRILSSKAQPAGSITCNVMERSAESIIQEHPEWFPNVIKIDVEGYEGVVFDGLDALLADSRLRCLGVEVHFRLLEERGERDHPILIEQSLKHNGFKVRWTDSSHLIALRD